MASGYGGSFMMKLTPDLDYQVGFFMVEMKRIFGKSFKYPKTQCIEDMISVAISNKEDTLKKLIEQQEKRMKK